MIRPDKGPGTALPPSNAFYFRLEKTSKDNSNGPSCESPRDGKRKVLTAVAINGGGSGQECLCDVHGREER